MDLKEVSRDQANTNKLLGWRKSNTTRSFVSKSGMNISVIPPQAVWAYHLADTEVASMDAVAFHGTCLDNPYVPLLTARSCADYIFAILASSAYKFYVARNFGFWQDVNGYYSKPPKILALPTLSGTEAEVQAHLAQFIHAGLASTLFRFCRLMDLY